MCGRFANAETEQTLQSSFKVHFPSGMRGHNRMPRYNISPGVEIETVIDTPNGRELAMMHWGFMLGSMTRPVINARSETMFEKPSFAALAQQTRCIIVATGWYEWKAPRQPYFIRSTDHAPMAMAGLYRKTDAGRSAVVVTRSAEGPLGEIHHRAPLTLDAETMSEWLHPGSTESALRVLARATDGAGFEWCPVSAEVGKVRVDHEGLITADATHGQAPPAQMDLF